MNDYLSNLIIRSVPREQNTTNLFRPRLPSLFEFSITDGRFPISEIDQKNEELDLRQQLIGEQGSSPNATLLKPISKYMEPSQTILSTSQKENYFEAKPISYIDLDISKEKLKAPQTEDVYEPKSLTVSIDRAERAEDLLTRREEKYAVSSPSNSKPISILRSYPKNNSLRALSTRMEQFNEPESIVHVHIGRVEVRALTSSPSTNIKRSDSRLPNLTLDEYLRQRNEGKR